MTALWLAEKADNDAPACIPDARRLVAVSNDVLFELRDARAVDPALSDIWSDAYTVFRACMRREAS